MSCNYTLAVCVDGGLLHEILVRLVGLINENECEAVLNTKYAARKISTSAAIDLRRQRHINGKRFVVVVSQVSIPFGKRVPNIFISSVIKSLVYVSNITELGCADILEKECVFKFTPINNNTNQVN